MVSGRTLIDMPLAIARRPEKASRRPFPPEMLCVGEWAMVIESRQLKKGSVNDMAAKAPRGGNAKKAPKLTLKEKREVKPQHVV